MKEKPPRSRIDTSNEDFDIYKYPIEEEVLGYSKSPERWDKDGNEKAVPFKDLDKSIAFKLIGTYGGEIFMLNHPEIFPNLTGEELLDKLCESIDPKFNGVGWLPNIINNNLLNDIDMATRQHYGYELIKKGFVADVLKSSYFPKQALIDKCFQENELDSIGKNLLRLHQINLDIDQVSKLIEAGYGMEVAEVAEAMKQDGFYDRNTFGKGVLSQVPQKLIEASQIQILAEHLTGFEKLDSKIIGQLIEDGYGSGVAENLKQLDVDPKYYGLLVDTLIEDGQYKVLINTLKRLKGIDSNNVATRLIEAGQGQSVANYINSFDDLKPEIKERANEACRNWNLNERAEKTKISETETNEIMDKAIDINSFGNSFTVVDSINPRRNGWEEGRKEESLNKIKLILKEGVLGGLHEGFGIDNSKEKWVKDIKEGLTNRLVHFNIVGLYNSGRRPQSGSNERPTIEPVSQMADSMYFKDVYNEKSNPVDAIAVIFDTRTMPELDWKNKGKEQSLMRTYYDGSLAAGRGRTNDSEHGYVTPSRIPPRLFEGLVFAVTDKLGKSEDRTYSGDQKSGKVGH